MKTFFKYVQKTWRYFVDDTVSAFPALLYMVIGAILILFQEQEGNAVFTLGLGMVFGYSNGRLKGYIIGRTVSEEEKSKEN